MSGQAWTMLAGYAGLVALLRIRAGGRWGRTEWACALLFVAGWGTLALVPVVFWARLLGCCLSY